MIAVIGQGSIDTRQEAVSRLEVGLGRNLVTRAKDTVSISPSRLLFRHYASPLAYMPIALLRRGGLSLR